VRTYHQLNDHETMDRAAALAYYAMLSLVPFLGLLLAGGAGAASNQLLALVQQLLPRDSAKVIEDEVRQMQDAPPVGLLSFSTVVLLWSASSAFVGLMDATNAAYGVRDSRPWWKRRLMAAVLTLIEVGLLAGALVLILAWPCVMAWIGLGGAAAALASLVQWLVVLIALLATFAIAYFFGPDAEQEWEWITPGSTLGVLVLIAASIGLRLYVQYGGYGATYGALAGIALTLLWLYIASLALLVGAELNCVIEHAAPHGRAPGQKEVQPVTPGSPAS
jgi:membrane protein